MSIQRRQVMQGATLAGLLATMALLPREALAQAGWNKAAFDAKTVDELAKALGASKPVESKDVAVQGPDIAENGAVVPIGASTTAPGVKRMMLMVDKNPVNLLAAIFELSDAVEPNVSTRVKMAQTSNVYAIAVTADNKVLYASKEIKVTLGGCGG
jgi:sulfur-oxidizing protein SoxY